MSGWHGSYLSEDEIVTDMLAKIKADPEAVKRWNDPRSWRLPDSLITLCPVEKAEDDCDYAGCMMFAGMNVRNYYGLWHKDNPYTLIYLKQDHPQHPDNLSGRAIDRVRFALVAEANSAALRGRHDSDCAVHNAPALPVGPCDCGAQCKPCS